MEAKINLSRSPTWEELKRFFDVSKSVLHIVDAYDEKTRLSRSVYLFNGSVITLDYKYNSFESDKCIRIYSEHQIKGIKYSKDQIKDTKSKLEKLSGTSLFMGKYNFVNPKQV